MIELTARPARTSFFGPKRELKIMFKCLRVKDKNSWWRQRAALKRVGYFSSIEDSEKRNKKIEKLKESTKWIKFYDRRSDTFATGLLRKVCLFLKEQKIEYKVQKHFKHNFDLQPIKKLPFDVEQREEQIEIVNASLKKKRGIIHAATNAGKTECAAAIISTVYRQTKKVPRVLFLIHRASLVRQTVQRFRNLLCPIKCVMVGSGHKRIPDKGIVVATVQTASRILQTSSFQRFQEHCTLLFIDELHLNKAQACSKIVKDNAATMRFSLSGTVDKDNERKMMHYVGMTGPIIAEIKNKELVEKGRSAKPIITFTEVHSEKIPKDVSYAEAYRLGIIRNRDRNELIVRDIVRYAEKNFQILVTIRRTKHGHILKQMIENRLPNLRTEFLWGASNLSHRERVIKQFEKKKVSVLIGSSIFDVGMDIPAIQAAVNAAGGVGWELTLQWLGRMLRKKKTGKNVVYISDYIDLQNKHLLRHSLKRMEHFEKEEIADISIKEG